MAPFNNMSFSYLLRSIYDSNMTQEAMEEIDVFFRVKLYEDVDTNNELDRCEGLAFFSLDNLPKATAPFIRHALQCIQKKGGV
jgi:hypothetical protein